jgi:outer membrane protein OmpA-like peptidoglycan-associated protein
MIYASGVTSMSLFQPLVIGISLVTAGCHKTAMDTAEPEPAQPISRTPAVAPPPTVTHVSLDPGVAALCNIASTRSYFESDSTEPVDSPVDAIRELVACITSGPLQGRRLDLVGYTDPRGADRDLGTSRAESVRKAMLAHGAPADAVITRAESEAVAGPTDAGDWTFGRRVEILLAPRHGG